MILNIYASSYYDPSILPFQVVSPIRLSQGDLYPTKKFSESKKGVPYQAYCPSPHPYNDDYPGLYYNVKNSMEGHCKLSNP